MILKGAFRELIKYLFIIITYISSRDPVACLPSIFFTDIDVSLISKFDFNKINQSCSKVVPKSKSCWKLLESKKVFLNAKSCSKVAEHNLFKPTGCL